MDIHKLCRCCMKELEIWEQYIHEVKTFDMFSFCTQIKVGTDDNMPKHFCNDCIVNITSTYTFIQEALKIDIILRNIASRITTNIIIEPENSMKNNIPHLTSLELESCDVDNSPFDVTQKDATGHGLEVANIATTQLDSTVDITKKVCAMCGKQFTSTAWFNKHMEKEHTVTDYQCKACPKVFRKRCQLTAHEATHSEERKFSCTSCSKTYKLRKQLTTHLRVHSDDRPFECNICDSK